VPLEVVEVVPIFVLPTVRVIESLAGKP
jgi:hypothetical protein